MQESGSLQRFDLWVHEADEMGPFSPRAKGQMGKQVAATWTGAGLSLSFRTRLALAFALLFAVGLTGLIVNIISVGYIKRQFEHSHAAHHQLTSYLHLSNNAHLFFEAVPATQINGESAPAAKLVPLLAAVRNQLASLKSEFETGDRDLDQPHDDLVRLKAIEAQLGRLEHDIAKVSRLTGEGRFEEAERLLSSVSDLTRVETFFGVLSDAITSNHARVHSVDARAMAVVQGVEGGTYLQILVTVPLILLLSLYLINRLRSASKALLAGTGAIASGDLSHRIPDLPDTEFKGLGQSFNHMAEQLASQRAALKLANQTLEEKVQKRTAELQVANEELAKTDETRRRLFADISHELRTPLTIIRGEAEVSLRGREKAVDVYMESLQRIVAKCGHMGRLVDDLLFMARSEAGEVRFEKRPVAIQALLRDVIQDFSTPAQAAGILLSDELGEPDDMTVNGDVGRLRQAISIVLDNAVRYGAADDCIRVRNRVEADHCVIDIEDTGPGIPTDEVDRVFDRFFRGRMVSGKAAGTGLGLPVARAILEAHGGTIELSTPESGGTHVTIRIPAMNDQGGEP